MAFDIQAARKAGYTDDEIADFLGNQSKFDVAGARKAGYTAPEIVGFLSQAANDAVDRGPVTEGDPLTRVTPSTPSTSQATFSTADNTPRKGLLNVRDTSQESVLDKAAPQDASNVRTRRSDFEERKPLPVLKEATKNDPAFKRGQDLADLPLAARALIKANTGLAESYGGAARALGDFTGMEAVSQFGKEAAAAARATETGMGKNDTGAIEGFGPRSPLPEVSGYLKDMAEGAGASIAQVAGMGAGLGAGRVLLGMFATSAGQKYDEARNAGLNPLDALQNAALTGAFEVAGEKYAKLDKVVSSIGQLMNKGASAQAKRNAGETLIAAGVREIPSEMATYLGQSATDLLPGIGINQDMTMGEFLDGMRDTVVQAGMMGGAMGAGGAIINRNAAPAAQPIPSAEELAKRKGFLIQEATQEGLINIGAAQTVDDAIAAAAQATAPTPQTKAVDNIARLLGETPDVSQPGNIPAVDSGSPGLGAPEPTIGMDTGVGVSGAAERALDAGSAGNQPDGGTVPLGDGGATPALSPDIADTASRIRELEGAQRGEPASMWFGRRGDGYQTPEDASAALPSRQRVSPDLDWKVEQMPSGRYRLAGYDTQTQQPASFKVTLNPTGTATIIGNPDAIKAKLAEAGIDKVMSGADRVIVGTSQAQAAVQVLQQNQPAALANTAQPAINSVAKTSEIARLRQAVEDAPPITQQHIDAIKTLRAAVTKDAQDALSQGVMPVYVSNTGLTQVITPSAQRKGMYQVTRYNDTGAIGDSQYNSLEEAIRDNQIDQDRLPPEQADAHMQKLVEAEAEYQRKRSARDQNQPTREDGQAQAPAVEPKGGVYTLTDAISADGPVSETVRLIVRPDGSSAIQRENGDVIDVTNMIRAGFSAERAIAQSLGDDTSGKNVSRNDQNPPKKPEPKAKAPAVEAPAPAGSDATGTAVPAPAGPAKLEGGGLNHKETPPEPGIYKLANGAFAKFDDGMWTRGESDPKAAMRSQMFIPGNMKPADREADQAWQFHSGFTRDAMGEPARLKPAKATNPPTQAQAGTPAEGAGESRPAPVAAPEPTAEQKIRQVFDAAPRTIGSWHKLTVEHNGKTQEFLANMKRVNTSGKRDSAIHLVNIRPGRLMAGDPLQDLAYYYKLDGKNNLVEEGIPSIATPEQLKAFGRPDPRLIPVSQRNVPKKEANLNTSAEPAQKTPGSEQVGPYGRDLTPIAQGGKPFKSLEEARKYRKKNTNNMVVKKVGKNQYVLQEASAKQLAAWDKAGKRLGIPQTGGEGPQHVHGFLIGKGGLNKKLMADAGFDRNHRIGNRTLFAGTGGMTAERATELLAEAGYLKAGASHSDMFALVRKSVQTPQYTSDGWEQLAQAEQSTRFEDHLAVEQEATPEADDFDALFPRGDDAYTPEEIALVPKSVREEYAALMEAAEAAGVDVDAILEDGARINENQTQEQYNEYVRQALTDAIADSRREADRRESAVQGRQDAERGGTEGSRQDAGRPGAQEEGLTTPTPAQVLEQQRQREAEQQRKEQGGDKPLPAKQLTGDVPDMFDYQGGIFDQPADPDAQQPAPEPEPERFAAGKALTKEQRKQVLATLTDVYKTKRAERELKGVGRDGNERYGYVHSPELFEKSDITGAMVRYYVTLPDGKIAHPTELFPDYTQSDIDAEMQARETRKRDRKSDVLRATVPAQQFSTIQEATEWWDKRSRESSRTATGLPTIFPAAERMPLTNGDKIILIPNTSSAEMVEAFADEGWKRWTAAQTEPAKPAAEMSAAELLRAAADKMEAAEKLKAEPAKAPEKIDDIGEKIGGARKDTAVSTGTRKKTASEEDDRPTWAKRFRIAQVAGGFDVSVNGRDVTGKWTLSDTRTLDRMGQPKRMGEYFDSKEAAEAALPLLALAQKHRAVPVNTADGQKYEIWRDINDRKRVKVVDRQFDTRDEAMRYMAQNATQILETNTTFGEADLPKPESTQRKGVERRTGDVKGEDFRDTFGFRGVEFGLWNNQEERQEVMNAAYDGLLDLAEVLKVPPKAIGLNGDLALAFGARGKGLSGARAHYETDRVVMNLTKMNGAGALAHEWFHALDHYLARQDGKTTAEWKINKDGTRSLDVKGGEADMASSGFRRNNSGVREELRNAYTDLVQSLFTKAEQYVEDTARADKFVAVARGELEKELSNLRKDLSEQKDVRYYKRNNKPASAEQLAEFDAMAAELVDGRGLSTEWKVMPGKSRSSIQTRHTNETLEKLNELYKAVRGRSGFNTERRGVLDSLVGYMTRYEQRLKMLSEATALTPKTKRVPTSFAMDAKSLDQGRGGDYWTSPHEMVARAFQGYVEDAIAAKEGRSPFLNYAPENAGILTPWGAKRPFPAGEERKAMNAEFDKFIDVLQTRETDDGNVAMFSRTPAWRSDLRDKVAAIKMESSKEEGWRAYISGLATKGVKPDEIEWSGVTDWLKLQTGKVTKQQVLDYLDGNGVQVEEVVLDNGDGGASRLQEQIDALNERHNAIIDEHGVPIHKLPDSARAEIESIEKQHDDLVDKLQKLHPNDFAAKYNAYQLPGGKNYREVLLTLPESRGINRLNAVQQRLEELRMAEDLGAEFDALRKEEVDLIRGGVDKSASYRSSHWDTPNVLAHIRLNDRVDSEGRRVLFVEEVQSDWGQEGKKKGFDTKVTPEQVALEVYGRPLAELDADEREGAMMETEARNEGTGGAAGTQGGVVPRGPFVTSTDKWLSLALKRIITMAAQEGYDRVAFVNGEQSAERYDLSKQVDYIDYVKSAPDRWNIAVVPKNGDDIQRNALTAEQLEELVGKEVAQKIVNGEGQSGGGRKTLRGLDLKVGGEGMRAFYDKILPNTLKDVLKKVGGQGLESIDIGIKERRIQGERETPEGRPMAIVEHPRNGMLTIELDNGTYWGMYGSSQGADESRALAEREFARISKAYSEKAILQPGFTITPEMRNKAANGLPMFRPGFQAARMPLAKAQSIVADLTKKWKNAPPIEVVATPSDLPMGAPDDARGVYWQGKVWVVAGPHKDRADIAKTLGHEAIAHFGLKNILTASEWDGFMRNIQLAIKSKNKALTAIRDDIRKRYVDESGKLYLTEKQEADEIAAAIVEQAIGPDGDFRPGFGFVKSVYARIMQFLRELGLDVKLTLAEVQGMLVLAQKNLEAGKRTVGQGDVVVAAGRGDQSPMDMRAYHGTPHKVDKFSTEKIGTGEGAQAYGWGLYFTDTKEIAEHYRKNLSDRAKGVKVNGVEFVAPTKDLKKTNAQERAAIFASMAVRDGRSLESKAREIEFAAKRARDNPQELTGFQVDGGWADANTLERAASILRGWALQKIEPIQGNLYEVEIPEASEMLLWDKPLSEQPLKVREALAKLDWIDQSVFGEYTGQQLYEGQVRDGVTFDNKARTDAQRNTSLAMLNAGIKGIKYLDGVSRNKPLRDVKREFLAELPEDAEFDDVMDLLGTGTFSPKNEAVIKALAADDWLGFDYPAQALSAALSGQLSNFDASPALVNAVAETQDGSTYNYVVFSGDDVAIQNAMFMRAKDQTNTPEFRNWFGDSVVTDTGKAGGKPLVVYHGTGVNVGNRGELISGDFDTFDPLMSGKSSKTGAPSGSFFFTNDPEVASSYTVQWRGDFSEKLKDDANVMPVYLSLRKPLKISAKGENWRTIAYKGEDRDVNEIVRMAQESGKYDGVIIKRVLDHGVGKTSGKPSTTYVAFTPEQIKSATGNRGTFDPADPNIMFSRGTTAEQEQEEQPRRPNIALRAIGYQGMDDAGSPEFSPGRLLYNMIGAGAGPLLTKMNLKAASPELSQIMRKMKIDVAKAQETAAAVAKESMALTEDERQMVSDLIEKELQAGTVPPEHAIRLAATINTVMGKQTDELLRLGMLTPESAERWRGEYLPRFYESKLTATASDLWADAVRKAAGGGKPLKGIRGKHLRGRGMYETIPVTQLADYETMGWEVRDPDYQPGLTDDGMVQVWRDFTRQERDKMGEIRDAGFRFVMGYMQTQKDIALGRMFEALATNPELSSKNATEELSVQVPTGTAPGTEVKTYGKLAGRYVSPETLSQLSMIEEAQSEALMMYRKAMGLWKEAKTVLNPVAHANNVISNITMAHFAGVSYGRVDKYLAAIRDFATKSDDVLEAKEAGLFLGTMNEAELFNTLPEELKALAQTQEGTATKIGRSAFNLLSFYLRKPMGWAYQAEDTFFRYLIYKDARGRGLSPDDAVDYAQKFIFTYDDLPQGARRVRDYGIPFFAYTYKAIPALLETALTHPERFAAPMAVIMAANAVAYAVAAGDDDDSWELKLKKYLTDPEYRKAVKAKEQLERELLPEWLKGNTSLQTDRTIRLGMDELTKLPMHLDISRMIPGGDMFDMHPNGGGLPWFQPLTPNHPLLSMYGAMFLNKDAFYGKDIVSRTDTAAEASRKRMDWMWKQMTPAIAYGNYHWERWMNALAQATGKEVQWAPEWATDKAIATGIGRDGLPVQPRLAAMQTFGIKARPYDLDKAEEIQRAMTNKDVREIEAEMRSLRRLMDLGAVSDRTYDRKREAADEKKERLRDGLTVDGKPR